MNGNVIFFLVMAAIAVAAALAMLLNRNAVYSALFLVLNFVCVAVLYLTLGAPFIALAQVTVYAGAIMVLFLFVIMLLGTERLPLGERVTWQRPTALVLGVALLIEILSITFTRANLNIPLNPAAEGFGSPMEIGLALFRQYLLPFEVTSVILLVAVIGAIVLTRAPKVADRHPQLRQAASEKPKA